jgi:tRNA pseudouridine38-40 synthase
LDTQKIRAVVKYDGTDFFGFQRQVAQVTIGGELEAALATLFKIPVTVICAGRTDAGVHASGQVVTFMAPIGFPMDRMAIAANSLLPRAVSLHRPEPCSEAFSARFDARSRHYIYLLLNRRERCALRARFTGHDYHALDVDAMRQATNDFCGTHDFRSFCGQLPEAGGTVRTIHAIRIKRVGELLRFDVSGNGFLHRMVRVTVGTLLEIGAGRRPVDDVPRILAARDRRVSGLTVEASGLYLAGVRYDDFDSFELPPLIRESTLAA